jgi:glycosyltransferase involved in cell wall biosynthesis
MNVLLLISSGGCYGAESMLISLAKGLSTRSVNPVIGVFHNTKQPNIDLARVAHESDLNIRSFSCEGRVDWRAIRHLRDVLRSESIDLLHTHGYKADCYGFVATRQLGLPWVSTCHGWTNQSHLLSFYAALNRRVLRRCSVVVAVSKELEYSLVHSGIPRRIVTSIPNGVDVGKFQKRHRKPNKSFVIGTASRLVEKKGIQVLLMAFSRLVEDFPNVSLLITGDGPFRPKLEQLTQDLNLSAHVVFLGQQRDMPGVYRQMDLFVLPSFQEGMPMCILEAMSTGVPVVATRVGGVSQILRHAETGWLVDPNDPTALARVLSQLIPNSELRSSMSRNASEVITQEFSSELMTARYIRVYEEALGATAHLRLGRQVRNGDSSSIVIQMGAEQ